MEAQVGTVARLGTPDLNRAEDIVEAIIEGVSDPDRRHDAVREVFEIVRRGSEQEKRLADLETRLKALEQRDH